MRPQEPSDNKVSPENRDKAVNIARGQVHAAHANQGIVHGDTHKDTRPDSQSDQWRQYHSAWQQYYQKYYEHYYTGHVHRMLHEQRTQLAAQPVQQIGNTALQSTSHQPAGSPGSDKKAALEQLQQSLRQKVVASAKKVRSSRHFIPITAATAVVVVFAFLQYNSSLIATVQAYVSPGTIDLQNIVVDPTASVNVSADPKLVIPKINVDVPVVYNVANTHDAQMAAMQNGIAHFAIPGADSVPGQVGNTVFSGHSSNDLFEPGDYKFIFMRLDKLQNGDTIYVNYQGTRYTYAVTKTEVVKPTDVQALTYATDKPMLTLITCTPLGTSTNRLLITAEQVSPDPSKATAASSTNSASGDDMPGNSPSAFEKIFGAKG